MVAGQHVAHRVAPARLTDETHGRAAAGKPAVRVLVLPETRVGRGDADIAREVDLVPEIPRVAVRHHHDRLRPARLGIPQRIERRRRARRALAGDDGRLRRVDVDAAREVLAMTEQDERAKRRVVLVLVEGFRQPCPRRRIEPVLDERAVETDEHDVATTLNGDRHRRTERRVRQRRHRLHRRLALRASRCRHRQQCGPLEERTASDHFRRSVWHGCPRMRDVPAIRLRSQVNSPSGDTAAPATSPARLQESSPAPPGDPHAFHSFSQFQIPYATSFGNGNPS